MSGTKKRSQISIFAILALVLLIFAGFVLTLGGDGSQVPQDLQPSDIRQYVESCLKTTLEQGVFYVGAQGGYYHTPPNSFAFGSAAVPYYYMLGEASIPAISAIENEMSTFIEEKMLDCIAGFAPFSQAGYEVSQGALEARVVIGENDVTASLEYPLVVVRGEDVYSISAFSTIFPFDFRSKYDIVEEIIQKQGEEPNYAPIGNLALSAYANEFYFETTEFPNSTVLYTLFFNETTQYREVFVYAYAAKYDWEHLSAGKAVSIEPIPKLEAYVGYPFTYDVHATGSNLVFSEYTSLFEINPSTGAFTFTPRHEDGGSHIIIVRAEDGQGNSDTTIFELEVKGYSIPPVIEPIADFILTVGQPFAYTVRASDEDNETILFIDNSTLFDINPLTGSIQFTPTASMVGTHSIKVTATDTAALAAVEEFEIKVE